MDDLGGFDSDDDFGQPLNTFSQEGDLNFEEDSPGMVQVETGDDNKITFDLGDMDINDDLVGQDLADQPLDDTNIIDIQFDELEVDESSTGKLSEDEGDYKVEASTKEPEKCHELSSPFSNGLVALRVEVVKDDGGVKAEDLKESQFYKNKSENFEGVVEQKNLTGKDEDVVCEVCQSGVGYEGDEILFCEGCMIAVHQSCYGSEIAQDLPKTDWFCHRCVYSINSCIKPKEVKCSFCPVVEGPMKRINQKEWGHLVCLNWMAEIWYKNEKYKEGIMVNSLQSWRTQSKCKICKKKQGALILCDHGNCNYMFHPTCGIKEELILDFEETAELLNLPDDIEMCPIYCPKHLQKHIDDAKNGKEHQIIKKNKQPDSSLPAYDAEEDDLDFTDEGSLHSEDSECDLDLEQEDLGNVKKPKRGKNKKTDEEFKVEKELRKAEKERVKELKKAEREAKKEERRKRLQEEKEARAIERKRRNEERKAQKLRKEKEKRKVVIRKPQVLHKEEQSKATDKWKAFMQMGKKREQEIYQKKHARKIMKEKKRIEKENKKKKEEKKKCAVVVTKRPPVEKKQDKAQNEALEKAKKDYLQQKKRQEAAIIIKTAKVPKARLRNAPKTVVRKKPKETLVDPILKDIKVEQPEIPKKTEMKQVPQGKFKFQEEKEVVQKLQQKENKVEEEPKKEFVNKPFLVRRDVKIQQSMKNFCSKQNNQVVLKKEAPKIVEFTEKVAINPYFTNFKKPDPPNFGFKCSNGLQNSSKTLENPTIYISKDAFSCQNAAQTDQNIEIQKPELIKYALELLESHISTQKIDPELENTIKLGHTPHISFTICQNCKSCIPPTHIPPSTTPLHNEVTKEDTDSDLDDIIIS
ncbi:unnamed protein product [Moneuplotes crassus]|uniref:Uncharacterized protein n=1 Tax=Euplotes crassus TaxID=5936 RepID=A0AAD1Y4V0_EUPCR|nr:unnamed protein product [Moneuplotes crassus]